MMRSPKIHRREFLADSCLGGIALACGCHPLAAQPHLPTESTPTSLDAASSEGRFCVDCLLPPERLKEAFFAAIKEDKTNDVLKLEDQIRADQTPLIGDPRIAIFHSKKWAQNRTLKVSFLGGTATVRKRVQEHADKWSEHVNIKLSFASGGPSEVRISFNPTDGSWSYMGTDNLTIPASRPTMNFGWLKDDSDEPTYTSVVLHEFGHLLGCIHEHQSAGGRIKWNEPKVIQDCWEKMGWPEKQVREQIFERYAVSKTQFTKLDRSSIMMYPFPASWTLDGFSTPWNVALSATDIRFMKGVYPRK
jgi:hypothetical protein